jgi:hypothetical protein
MIWVIMAIALIKTVISTTQKTNISITNSSQVVNWYNFKNSSFKNFIEAKSKLSIDSTNINSTISNINDWISTQSGFQYYLSNTNVDGSENESIYIFTTLENVNLFRKQLKQNIYYVAVENYYNSIGLTQNWTQLT